MSIKFAARIAGYFACVALFSLGSIGQDTPSSSQNPTAQPPAQNQPATPPAADTKTPAAADKDKGGQDAGKTPAAQSGTSKDRLFYALPNFLTLENSQKLPPLTAKQKFGVVARGTFDPVQYPWWGLLAGISQAENSEPAYGQGWVGYAKRYGTTAADSTIENFMVGAVFPSILHQDPRFYQSSQGGFAHRTGYAITRIFVTRSDSGTPSSIIRKFSVVPYRRQSLRTATIRRAPISARPRTRTSSFPPIALSLIRPTCGERRWRSTPSRLSLRNSGLIFIVRWRTSRSRRQAARPLPTKTSSVVLCRLAT